MQKKFYLIPSAGVHILKCNLPKIQVSPNSYFSTLLSPFLKTILPFFPPPSSFFLTTILIPISFSPTLLVYSNCDRSGFSSLLTTSWVE